MDTLYFKYDGNCENFLLFFKMILILSHGNATVERGFSVNAQCLVENQHEASLVAQREIYDAIAQTGGLENIEITPKLIHAYKNASSFYRENLKRTREENKKQEDAENLKFKN